METWVICCVSALGTCLTWQGYAFLRRHISTTVNCWFCNQDTRVDYKRRNSFTCPHCEQYNGFDESGDYNRKIPGQYSPCASQRRFCAPTAKEPDLLSDRRGNGLCTPCNEKQAIIVRKVGNFEPICEAKWEEELEDFRYRLNKLYPLCAQCTLNSHTRLQNDKIKYSYLLSIKDRVGPSVANACRTVTKMASKMTRGDRRHFFSGGFTAISAQLTTLACAGALFVAHLSYLQEDASVDLISLPPVLQMILPYVLAAALQLGIAAFVMHLTAFMFNRCRPNLPDLLLPFFVAIYICSYAFPEQKYREDLAVCRCAFAAFMVILSTAVTFVPRKKLHKKRPNRILSSAFSVASTPASQCSSMNQSSLSDHNLSNGNKDGGPVLTPSLSSRLEWRERHATPAPEDNSTSRFARECSPGENMDWEESASVVQQKSRLTAGREATPARELAPSLLSLSLSKGGQRPGSRSVFASSQSSSLFSPASPSLAARQRTNFLSSNPLLTPSYAASRFSATAGNGIGRAPSMSGFTSVSQIRPRNGQYTPPRGSPSEFTSISQQNAVSLSFGWMFFGALLILSSLLGNIALFYVVFQKKE